MRLIAVKPLKYGTRRLLPGDTFDVMKPREARVWLATKKAREVREPGSIEPPPPAVAAKIAERFAPPPALPADSTPAAPSPSDDLAALRAEYEAVVGKRPFMGWDAGTLREKIAAAKAA